MTSAARRVLAPHDIVPGMPPHEFVRREFAGLTMGTSWSVKCLVPPSLRLDVAGGVQAQLDRVVAQMSTWEAGSDLSRYNRAPAGSWCVLPEACHAVLCHALDVAQASDGAYDPTSGPLVNLWGFGPEGARANAPSAEELAAARGRVGWQRVAMGDGRRVLQPGGVYLDFSAIAKGFGVDAVAAWLERVGIRDALVEVGGELRGSGMKSDGQPWWVQLEHPPDAQFAPDEPLCETVVALHGLSVATSGDYRRYFTGAAGDATLRHSHTLDPRTGEPIRHGLGAVSVVHPSCMAADALSTALNVLGLEEGLRFAAARGIAARFIQRTARGLIERLSPAFEALCA